MSGVGFKKIGLGTIIILVLAIIVAIYGVSTALNTFSVTVSGSGSVSMLDVMMYEDAEKTVLMENIYWNKINNNHPITPNSEISTIIYASNEGNTPISLAITTENWIPVNCTEFMSLDWNYNGQILPVNASMPITLTLKVNEDIQGIIDFKFDIIYIGLEE